MVTKLRGTKPVEKGKRLKLFVFGPAGIGKTTAAIQFPKNYIFDLERGTTEYSKTINQKGSNVFQSNNPDEIEEETNILLTSEHDFVTVTFDPFTQYYNAVQEKWNRKFIQFAKNEKDAEMMDFGPRFWAKVKSEVKALQRKILALDMNVIVTAHQKDVFGQNFSKLGVTFDSMKGDDFLYDYIFRLELINGKRMAIKVKERAEIGANKFPDMFEWSYENFCNFYGAEILEKKSAPIKLASEDKVTELKRLLDIIKIDESIVESWLRKAGIEEFSEFTQEQIIKCIDFLEQKIIKK
jgi:hypothetical protein